jgi:hypothetical protein
MPEDKLAQGLQPVTNCEKMMKNVVYLPVNITVPKKEMDIMIKRVLGICYRYQLLAEYRSKQLNQPLDAKAMPIRMGQAKL